MAVAKIKAEMEQNKDNAYIQVVGNFVLQHISDNPAAAEQIVTEGKTLKGSLDAMRKVAEGKKVGNMAVLTPEEGYKAVLEYFGIEAEAIAPAPRPQAPKVDFDVNLDDLLPRP